MFRKVSKSILTCGCLYIFYKDDIEKILAQIEEEEKKKVEIKEIKIEKPTRRANFSFIGHPLKEELFLFGGEFFNGQKVLHLNIVLI